MNVVEILRTLVGVDTNPAKSNLPLIEWAAGYMERMDARIRLSYDDSGTKANLLASIGPDREGGVVLSGHTDVVPVVGQDWSYDPFTLTERAGRLYGRGTTDMKGFLAACLASAPSWSEDKLARPIHVAMSYDEEAGCLGVRGLIADMTAHVPPPALAIVGEPTGMAVADRHRGYLGFRTRFHGHAVHSSDPTRGVNAIAGAARFVGRLHAAALETAPPGEDRTTVNIGTISGGTGINVVPAHCDVDWEIRPASNADLTALRSTADTLVRVETDPAHAGPAPRTEEIITIPPLRSEPANPAVALARELGAAEPTDPLPFGTEAGHFQEAGIPTAVCGPGSIEQAHQADEWIAAAQLRLACNFLEGLPQWTQATRFAPRNTR